MERYKVIKEVGDGTFGNVCQAINKQTGQVERGLEPNGISKALKYGGVAIKKMKRKYYSWEVCLSLREVKSLRRLNHPNIIKLKEVIRENDVLYLVFEYMEFNLYQLMKERGKPFTEVEIRTWCFQIFRALAYMHQHGYFHRDLKPENLLVTKNVLKIADFGLAREISSKPPFTEYVATRWYRAPEILLQSSVYDSAVDMWAMGAIMAELFTFCPLFPGSSQVDELHKICNVIGPPNRNSWAEGLHLADAMKFQFPKVASVPSLSRLIPSASKDAINLISSLCSWDSTKRPTAAKVLQHPFFQPCFHVPASPRFRLSGVPETAPSDGMKGALESKTARRHSFGFTSNTRLSTNFSSSSVNEPLKPGLQRKMETSSKENENERSFTNDIKPPRHQTTAMSMPGFLGRDSQRVSMAAEKLSQFSLGSHRDSETVGKARHLNPHLARQQPPVLKAGSWYRHNDLLGRPQEIPSSQTCYSRKVAG